MHLVPATALLYRQSQNWTIRLIGNGRPCSLNPLGRRQKHFLLLAFSKSFAARRLASTSVALLFGMATGVDVRRLAHWTAARLMVLSVFRLRDLHFRNKRLFNLFRCAGVPESYPWTYHEQRQVVYLKLSHLVHSSLHGTLALPPFRERDLNRESNMRQTQKKRLAYHEPAIRWCHANANYSAFVTVVLQPVPGAVRALLAMESTCQEILEPRLNSPWVHTLLRKVGVHLTKPQHPMHGSLQASGRRLVCIYDRYCYCYNFDHALGLGFVLSNAELAFQLLYKLGDEGIGKFHASRVLRATYATALFLYLLWRLTVHLQEPFRMRSRNQLKSVFKFRKLLLPPLHCRIRSLQLSHDFVQALRKWGPRLCQKTSQSFSSAELSQWGCRRHC